MATPDRDPEVDRFIADHHPTDVNRVHRTTEEEGLILPVEAQARPRRGGPIPARQGPPARAALALTWCQRPEILQKIAARFCPPGARLAAPQIIPGNVETDQGFLLQCASLTEENARARWIDAERLRRREAAEEWRQEEIDAAHTSTIPCAGSSRWAILYQPLLQAIERERHERYEAAEGEAETAAAAKPEPLRLRLQEGRRPAWIDADDGTRIESDVVKVAVEIGVTRCAWRALLQHVRDTRLFNGADAAVLFIDWPMSAAEKAALLAAGVTPFLLGASFEKFVEQVTTLESATVEEL